MKNVSVALALLLALCRSGQATTLMVLTDWYQLGNMDSLVRVDSVWIAGYNGTSTGYVLDGHNQKLELTDRFAPSLSVNALVDPSAQVPRQLRRHWYGLRDFWSGRYLGQRVRFNFDYQKAVHRLQPMGTSTIVRIDSSRERSYSVELNGNLSGDGWIDRCIDSLNADTLWIRNEDPSPSSYPTHFGCYNRNPFLQNLGSLRFLPPYPVAKLEVEVDGLRFAMRPDPAWSGWYQTPLFSFTSSNQTMGVRFAAVSPATGEVVWDSLGSVWHVQADSGQSVWFSSQGRQSHLLPAPATPGTQVAVYLGVPLGERLALQADQTGYVGAPMARQPGWSLVPLWFRPAAVYGVDAKGQISTAIQIPASGDTIWLQHGAVVATPQLATSDSLLLWARAFDYTSAYSPFSESGPGDNCGLTKGLVERQLDSIGLPVWTGRATCDIGAAAASPAQWFRPGHAVLDTSISIFLRRDAATGAWGYANDVFFPLDKASSAPASGHNFGFCLHFGFESLHLPQGRISLQGDDDVWLFVDGQLRIDLGGQHGPVAAEFNFDRLESAPGSPVRLDLFQCERHPLGSSLSLVTTVPLYASGSYTFPPRPVVTAVQPAAAKILQILSSSRGFRLVLPVGQSWELQLRNLDGRRIGSWSGIGPRSFTAPRRGAYVVEVQTAGSRQTQRLFMN